MRAIIATELGEPEVLRLAEAERPAPGPGQVLVGRTTQEVSLAVLAPFGHLVNYGDASGPPPPIDPDRLYERSLKISSYTLNVDYRPERWAAIRKDLLRSVEEGRLRLNISTILPLADAAEAHRLIESRQSVGKIVLGVSSS